MDPQLQAIVDEAIKGVVGFGMTAALAWMAAHIKDATLRAAFNMAIQRGAGLAITHLPDAEKFAGDHLKDVANPAVQAGAMYVLNRIPGVLKSFGITEENVAVTVAAELGKLLPPLPQPVIVPLVPGEVLVREDCRK